MTGDGSLGLVRLRGDESVPLDHAPVIQDYAQIEQEVDGQVGRISAADVLKKLW